VNVVLLVPEMPPDSIGGGGVVFEALASRLAQRTRADRRYGGDVGRSGRRATG